MNRPGLKSKVTKQRFGLIKSLTFLLGIELNENVEQLCTQIALSPFAHAIDIQDNQCQDSTVISIYLLRVYIMIFRRDKDHNFINSRGTLNCL